MALVRSYLHVSLGLEPNKPAAESKQTADQLKNNDFSCSTTLYCDIKAISASIHKISAESQL